MIDKPQPPSRHVTVVPDPRDHAQRISELERGFARLLRDEPPAPPDPIVLVIDRDELFHIGLFIAAAIVGAYIASRA